jgi:hypothetical protein
MGGRLIALAVTDRGRVLWGPGRGMPEAIAPYDRLLRTAGKLRLEGLAKPWQNGGQQNRG